MGSGLVAKSSLTLVTPWSPPGSSVHGISQARILDWVAISSSRGSALPRDRICVSSGRQILYGLSYQGSCCLIGAPIQNEFKKWKKIWKKKTGKKRCWPCFNASDVVGGHIRRFALHLFLLRVAGQIQTLPWAPAQPPQPHRGQRA